MSSAEARPGARYTGRADSRGFARPDRAGTRIITHSDAVAIFLAGLPDFRRGQIVTSSSEPDSRRKKHPAIRDRLALASAALVRL